MWFPAIGLMVVCLLASPAWAGEPPGEPPAFVEQGQDPQARLVDVYRRLYLALPVGDRSALLGELIADPIDAVRTLGVDLTLRESSAGTEINPQIGRAALSLLSHRSPDARRQGAVLLPRLTPEGWSDAVSAALLEEHDPAAAGAMLRALSRQPRHDVLPAIARWLPTDGPAFEPAAQAARTAIVSGFFGSEQRAELLVALRSHGVVSMPRDALGLLVELGNDDDRHQVAGLLAVPDSGTRLRGAWALVGTPDSVAMLVEAAGSEPALLAPAVEAINQHGGDAGQFTRLARVESPPGFDRLAAFESPAAALSNSELVGVALGLGRADLLRDKLLAMLTDPERAQTEKGAVLAGVVLLAEDRLASDRPEPALAALARLPQPLDLFSRVRARRVSVIANLMLGKIDKAGETMTPPAAAYWLEGLERSIDQPWAYEMAEVIGREVMPLMTPPEQARYAELALRLPIRTDNDGQSKP